MTGFALRSLHAERPALIDVRIIARRSFGLSSVITFVAGFSLYALMFLLPIFYQQARGDSALATGCLLIPQGLGTMGFIVLNRHLTKQVDTRLVIAGSVAVTMIGILPFTFAGISGGDVPLLVGQLLQGFGMAAVSLPVMTMAFNSLSDAETPRGKAAFSVVQRVGAPFGVTVIAVILQHYLTKAATPQRALHAFTNTYWWVFAFSVIPALLAFLRPTVKTAVPAPPRAVTAE